MHLRICRVRDVHVRCEAPPERRRARPRACRQHPCMRREREMHLELEAEGRQISGLFTHESVSHAPATTVRRVSSSSHGSRAPAPRTASATGTAHRHRPTKVVPTLQRAALRQPGVPATTHTRDLKQHRRGTHRDSTLDRPSSHTVHLSLTRFASHIIKIIIPIRPVGAQSPMHTLRHRIKGACLQAQGWCLNRWTPRSVCAAS